jgi:glycosyltransferase involved in cell wall biosynthesis
MKIAVYTIALNEEQFVQRWYDSCHEADYLLIADTGSTDKTVELARSLGIDVVQVSIKPWRFDDARNAALAMLPANIDYCISLDMDEVLSPGWREEMEKVKPGVNRVRYNYTWNFNPDGTPGLTFGGDKIHARHGYRWKHPVHECLYTDRIELKEQWINLGLLHKADDTKSRGQYLPLLKLSVEEDPTNDRNAYYYARELFFHGQYRDAEREFKRHLSLPTAQWKPERAASMRYIAKCDPDQKQKIHWLQKAVKECPERREAFVELGQVYYDAGKLEECLTVCKKALAIKDRPMEYLCEEFAWGYIPHDLAAVCSYWTDDKEAALKYGEAAHALNPTSERLTSNLEFYKLGVASESS